MRLEAYLLDLDIDCFWSLAFNFRGVEVERYLEERERREDLVYLVDSSIGI